MGKGSFSVAIFPVDTGGGEDVFGFRLVDIAVLFIGYRQESRDLSYIFDDALEL